MTIALNQIVRQNEDTAFREIDGLAYVVDPTTSDLHSFSEVATRIWVLLDGKRTVSQVVDVIVDEFDVDRATAEADALELLDALLAKGLVVL
jgi:pyrroloquinoline quinone biosynthesis protein D